MSPTYGQATSPAPLHYLVCCVSDGERVGRHHRVLVDKRWPRGVSTATTALDEWLKDIAPSTELRRWYGFDPVRFDEFRRRYHVELRRPPAAASVDRLVELARSSGVTLITAARDVDHCSAKVLQEYLASQAGSAKA